MKDNYNIEPTENGWRLRHTFDEDEYTRDDKEWGFEINPDTRKAELQTLQRLLYTLLDECMGQLGSKHDELRLRVIIVNQDGQEVE